MTTHRPQSTAATDAATQSFPVQVLVTISWMLQFGPNCGTDVGANRRHAAVKQARLDFAPVVRLWRPCAVAILERRIRLKDLVSDICSTGRQARRVHAEERRRAFPGRCEECRQRARLALRVDGGERERAGRSVRERVRYFRLAEREVPAAGVDRAVQF